MPEFIFTNFAQKRFNKLNSATQTNIFNKLISLKTQANFQAIIKPLKGIDESMFRLRIGDY